MMMGFFKPTQAVVTAAKEDTLIETPLPSIQSLSNCGAQV